jgi:hypothetical protein
MKRAEVIIGIVDHMGAVISKKLSVSENHNHDQHFPLHRGSKRWRFWCVQNEFHGSILGSDDDYSLDELFSIESHLDRYHGVQAMIAS